MTTTQYLTLALFILGLFFSLIGYLMRTRIEKTEDDIKQIQTDMKEFKDNYLDRFEQVNKTIADSKIEIIKEISKLSSKIK